MGTFTWWPSMSLIAFTPGDISRCAFWNANARTQSIFASASGSIGVPSKNGPAMSTFCAGHRELERLGGAAHREQEAALLDEVVHPPGHGLLERGHVGEAVALRGGEVVVALLDEPRRVAEPEVQLVLLAGEILVVQVDPVELGEVALSISSSQICVYSMPA